MNIFAINICTDTKSTDRYNKVAVNPYPIIVISSLDNLKDKLSNDDTKQFIKNLFRTKPLYDSAVFRIRSVDDEGMVDEFEWKVSDICELNETDFNAI